MAIRRKKRLSKNSGGRLLIYVNRTRDCWKVMLNRHIDGDLLAIPFPDARHKGTCTFKRTS